jgi:hypothetical protein
MLSNLYKNYPFIMDLAKGHSAILAGGALLSSLLSQEVHDYDFYFRTAESQKMFFDSIIENMLAMGNRNDTFEKNWYKLRDAVDTYYFKKDSIPVATIQAIKMYYGEAKDIINKFDLNLSQIAYDFKTNKTVYGNEFLTDLNNKTLKIKNYKSPQFSLLRIIKYIVRYNFKVQKSSLAALKLLLSRNNNTNDYDNFEALRSYTKFLKEQPIQEFSWYREHAEYDRWYIDLINILSKHYAI